MSAAFRKGDLARVVPGRWGYRSPMGIHIYTRAEYEEVRQDPSYRGLNDAGETHIAPIGTHVALEAGSILHILRARARLPNLYNRDSTGWLLAVSTQTGQEIYIQDKYLQPVGETTTDQETET